jgi:tetratricopeptide (TPR) repeat protein
MAGKAPQCEKSIADGRNGKPDTLRRLIENALDRRSGVTLALIDLLAIFYQSGNLERMEAIARSMLVAVPNDVVALQFLALSLYLRGRTDEAYRLFRKYVFLTRSSAPPQQELATSCELAASASYRAATRPGSGLAKGWHGIAQILARLGYVRHAMRARRAAITSDVVPQ